MYNMYMYAWILRYCHRQKGSDASWKDDNEVPAQVCGGIVYLFMCMMYSIYIQFQDFSDDESEQRATARKSRDRCFYFSHTKSGMCVVVKCPSQSSLQHCVLYTYM